METPPVLVAAFKGQVFGLDPVTGVVLWEHDLGSHTPRIVVTETHIFVAGFELRCLAYPGGELVWRQPTFVTSSASLVLSAGRLFVGAGGEVECFSAVDGKPLWKNKFPGKGSDVVALGTPGNVMQADQLS